MNVEIVKAIVYLLTGGFLVFLGITVTRDNITNRVNRVTGGMLFFAGLGPITLALGLLLTPADVDLPLSGDAVPYGLHLVWQLFFPTLVAFSLQFPYNRLAGWKRSRLIYLLLVPQITQLLLISFYGELADLADSLDVRASEGGFGSIVLGPLSYLVSQLTILLGYVRARADVVFGAINLLYVLIAFYLLETGKGKQSNPRLITQTTPVLWGLRIGVGLYLIGVIGDGLMGTDFPEGLTTTLRFGALVAAASFLTYAIVRKQFLDVRLVFRQSLIYAITSIVLVGSYIVLGMRAEEILYPVFGERAQPVSYFFIVLLLLLFPSISNWIDNVIKSMFMRTRSDYRNIMERFSRHVISQFDPDRLRQTIEETLKTALLVDQVFFVLYDDSVGEYALLRSEDNPRRMVINREDLMLRGINLLDRPTNFSSMSDYEEDSALAVALRERRIEMLLPLKDAQHLIGFLALTAKAAGYRYSPEDFNLLGVLSNQMVTALTNARLYADSLEKIRLEEEISMARQIQLDLLPACPPTMSNAAICADSTPSRTVGGDFYDFIPVVGTERIGLVIADASGKGMPAALLIAQIQAIIHSEVNNGNPIPAMMKNMNHQIYRSTSAEKYVTLFYGEFDQVTNRFQYANAGHNHPILVRSNGSVELLDKGGPVIGALPGMEYESDSVQLNENDLLFLFTDGLSEAMDAEGHEYGEDRIRDFVASRRDCAPDVIVSDLVRDVRRFDPSHPPQDDTTMVAFKMTNGGMISHGPKLG